MDEDEIAKNIVDCAYHIHTKLGPGLMESVYQVIMVHELEKRGLAVLAEVPVPIEFDGIRFDMAFRADIIVEDKVIIELKSCEQVLPVHKKQLLTYLKLSNKRLGLLINYGEPLIKNGITRIANGL